ncbi:TetR/AcrR family transcriptional regulator [Leifsonia sp. P73]|uniref:TetR/AcrR family transcriptional regulator n=1 Tax=Leifsonia sp. P73 TaxID=3423959 RepID=UPI003DA3D63A
MDQPADARTRILDAAETLFAERGFDATATSAIAHAAAVPKGLLFYYFPSKKDILASLVGERLGPGRIDPDPLIEPGNPVRSLLNLSQKLFRVQADSDVLRVIVWREQHSHPEVKAKLAAHRRALHSTIEKVLAGSLRIPVGGSGCGLLRWRGARS